MNQSIGESLPLAIGIAISPVPIIATILMLMSSSARRASLGFLLGWVVGVVAAVTAFTLLAGVLPSDDGGGSNTVMGVVRLLLGGALLVLAAGRWRARPAEGETPKLPKWMAAIDAMNPSKALVLGFLLMAVNPKNLLLAVSVGVGIGHADLGAGSAAVVIAVMVVVGSCTVAIPVIAYQLAPSRIGAGLHTVRTWLVSSNATIMAVLLLVLGVHQIGKGIGSF